MAPYLSPELTTINQHSFTMGKTAATLLIEQLESKDVNNQTIVINSTLSKDLLLRLICDFLQYLTILNIIFITCFLKNIFTFELQYSKNDKKPFLNDYLSNIFSNILTSQENSDLVEHYKSYYNQMQKQGDVQGIINAMTHLLVLEPNIARKDTLAALYMNEGKYVQALNLLGIKSDDSDSDMAVEVKAVCLKSLNEPSRAIEHYELLFKRFSNPSLAYELAD